MTEHRVGTVLLPPIPDGADDATLARLNAGNPNLLRLVHIATAHPGEWPWRRLTGLASDVPAQGTDLSGWRVQPWWQVGQVLGHA